MANLIESLCSLLNCKLNELSDYLNHPINVEKVDAFLKGRLLETTYSDREGNHKLVDYDSLSTQNSNSQMAYNGYLKITVHQHFYTRHRIRLMYPTVKCIVARLRGTNRALGFYPAELLRIKAEEDAATPCYINEAFKEWDSEWTTENQTWASVPW